MKRALFFAVVPTLFFSFSLLATTPSPQDTTQLKKIIKITTEAELQLQLQQYVYNLFIEYSEDRLPQERFLVGLMQLINKEMSRRLENPKQARKDYFNDLRRMLEEIHQLKLRLKTARISDLDVFVDDLAKRITRTIESGEIHLKKKKVFEDALQLLYVAEEMIKLDQAQQPETQLTQKIGRSKERLLSAFGEVPDGAASPVDFQQPVTIYHLFDEWRKTDLVQYSLRLADVKLARQNLLKTSGLEEILRMMNDQLRTAYQYFNYGEYDFSERLLQDVIETYPSWGVKNLDDVYFYWGESNFVLGRYQRAQEIFEKLLQEYPGTTFLADTYSRLIQLNYSLQNYQKVIGYAGMYQNIASQNDPTYGDIQFLIAMSYYENGNFDRSVETFLNLPGNHSYYFLGQYFMGNAYSEAQLYSEARTIYEGLLQSPRVPPELYSRAAYKLAILDYEMKNYPGAIAYLNLIPASFSRYDKVLNAFAWSYFEMERAKPSDMARDFSLARAHAQVLVNNYYASPLNMEAKSLLAYINQIYQYPNEAIELYREVYQVKLGKKSADEYISERERIEDLHFQAQHLKEIALQKNNPEAYRRAMEMEEELENKIYEMQLAEVSGTGSAAYGEVSTVLGQLEELGQLKKEALEAENKRAVEKIDSLRLRLVAVLETFPMEYVRDARVFNLFDDNPVGKLLAENNSRLNNLNDKKIRIHEEMAAVNSSLQEVNAQITSAGQSGNYALLVRLEQKKRQLEDIQKSYDRLLTATYEMPVEENPYPEFNRWADLGAFGIINVHFDQKQRVENLTRRIAKTLDHVNEQLDDRKTVIEDKIKKIEAEIRFMTMRARMEERQQQRAERERAFRESYFDTRKSETEPEQ